ncbi:hypothetical protein PSN13_05530 [Micromonospora saelicesensis]|uniref:Uncharacterized protein n=1 Tax=Micromonospora saelicesensis TaxID=285676 RepID=A0A328NK46_9ACTN|nr:hypothetical protein PSN13_05530 [Micromonospora saelicesensis]
MGFLRIRCGPIVCHVPLLSLKPISAVSPDIVERACSPVSMLEVVAWCFR